MTTINTIIKELVTKDHELSDKDYDQIQNSVINPDDPLDVVTPDERDAMETLYRSILSGNTTVNSENSRDLAFEIKNLAETVVIEGDRNFFDCDWFNTNTAMIDLKGVTIIQEWFTGNHNRRFLPYAAIETAAVNQGITIDELSIKTSGSSGESTSDPNDVIAFQEERYDELSRGVNLINQRINDWNIRVNNAGTTATPGTTTKAEASDCKVTSQIEKGADGNDYVVFTSPNCNVAAQRVVGNKTKK